ETGLAEGTPVTCGTIDAASEAGSVGAVAPGDMVMMYGSTIFTIQITAERLQDARLWHAPWLYPGEFAAMAGLATSGTLTHWFRDQFARDLPRETAFATLTAEAMDSPPGARGLLCLPYFSGERTPLHDPQARGAFFGLDLTHRRGDMYRAVLEGIASATRHITETYAEAGASPRRVLAVGGGTKNQPWLQATSDLTGLDQVVCRVTVGASFGDAYLAAKAIGMVADMADWNPVAHQVQAVAHPVYARQYPLFRALYEQTRDIAAALGG
ncbi:MAG: carbohydrate kinase, partial [Pseudorhodobacter sp.]|nr:carbohydrate kinase [Pseudorhodobacter sp.]